MVILCGMSFLQKTAAGFDPYLLRGYYVPLIFGGISGAVLGIYISREKAATIALQESETRFRTIADFTYDWEYWMKPEGTFAYVSPSCQRITGYAPAAFLDKPELMTEMIHCDDLSAFTRHLKEERDSDAPLPIDFRIITTAGEVRWISHSCQSVYDADGHFLGKRGSNRDITRRKKLEQETVQNRQMQTVGKLAGGVAHQFNNSLAVITGNIDLLEDDFPDNELIQNYSREMKKAAKRMVGLTAQLLAYAGGGKYQVRTLSLNDFIKEILPVIRDGVDSRIVIHTDLADIPLQTRGDPSQMEMVMRAMLSNASEAMGGRGEIRIKCRKFSIQTDTEPVPPALNTGDYACLRITDDGKGMTAETRECIFEPFFSTRFEGRGLGMAAAFGIVKNHGGTITVDSRPQEGTTFSIFLPLVEALPTTDTHAPRRQHISAVPGKSVLLIEDEKGVMAVSRQIFQRLGYHVLEAETGKEALSIADRFDGTLELAMLDVMLPDIQGDALFPRLKKIRPDLKVIVTSGYSLDSPARNIMRAGAEGFIQKPFTMKELTDAVEQVTAPVQRF